MRSSEIAIIGGGPAGMCAALTAAKQGAKVVLFDSAKVLGGQLIKQTHRFFGSEKEHAGMRGIQICTMLEEELGENENIEIHLDATVISAYDNRVIAYEEKGKYEKAAFKKIIIATGAGEKMLPFVNNDLPGVYGAGAVQTLMNVHGVIPGERVLMVGSGNIGLIVSYQLIQAGVKVGAIIEGAPDIGGYKVHAGKVRRMGVPILTSHTILEASGNECVEKAIICELDDQWQQKPGTEKEIDVDTICLAVGLSPLTELLWQVGCQMRYIAPFGGHVPERDENMETTVSGFYVAGDASGVEEASAAMIEGKIAGLAAAATLGYTKDYVKQNKEYAEDLRVLRSGSVGEKIRQGLQILAG